MCDNENRHQDNGGGSRTDQWRVVPIEYGVVLTEWHVVLIEHGVVPAEWGIVLT